MPIGPPYQRPLRRCDFVNRPHAGRRHDACRDEETQDGDAAYARFPPSQPTRYRDGLLPG